jgi:hypothetical protein
MGSPLPVDAVLLGELDESLVEKLSGLQRVVWSLSGEEASGNPSELLVHQWRELFDPRTAAGTDSGQHRRQFVKFAVSYALGIRLPFPTNTQLDRSPSGNLKVREEILAAATFKLIGPPGGTPDLGAPFWLELQSVLK